MRRLKVLLHVKDKRCHWCGIETVLYAPENGILSDRDATLDHVVSCNYRKKGEPTEIVLACYKCNNDRNKAEQKAMTTLEKYHQCFTYPTWIQ